MTRTENQFKVHSLLNQHVKTVNGCAKVVSDINRERRMKSETLSLWPAEYGLANNDWFSIRDCLWGNFLPKQGCHYGNAKPGDHLYSADSNDCHADCGLLSDRRDCQHW